MATKAELGRARLELARDEYLNRYILTCSFLEAETAYRSSLGDLQAPVPPELELDAIRLRKDMLNKLRSEILTVRRKEYQEMHLVHAHIRRLTLTDETAETGIPDEISLEDLRGLEADDLNAIINAVRKLQEMRRDILSS